MTRLRYRICKACLQRKDYSEFGLADNQRDGRQLYCHECVVNRMKERGIFDDYVSGEFEKNKRNNIGALKDIQYMMMKGAQRGYRLAQAKKKFLSEQQASRIEKFKSMFPQSSN